MKTLIFGRLLFAALILALVPASCVSKKKYKQSQLELTEQRQVSQNYRLRIDTLQQQVVVLTDSVKKLDSLLGDEKQKVIAARRSGMTKPGTPVKKSSLSREDEASKKSVFMLTFARNVTWPATFQQSKIIIGVIDDDNVFYNQLKKTFEGKTAGGKPVEIKKFTIYNITTANIIYIAHNQINNFSKIKAATKNEPALLVTEEGPSGYSNSHINYYVNDTKVQYSLNKPLIDKSGLKISQDLIKYADK